MNGLTERIEFFCRHITGTHNPFFAFISVSFIDPDRPPRPSPSFFGRPPPVRATRACSLSSVHGARARGRASRSPHRACAAPRRHLSREMGICNLPRPRQRRMRRTKGRAKPKFEPQRRLVVPCVHRARQTNAHRYSPPAAARSRSPSPCTAERGQRPKNETVSSRGTRSGSAARSAPGLRTEGMPVMACGTPDGKRKGRRHTGSAARLPAARGVRRCRDF